MRRSIKFGNEKQEERRTMVKGKEKEEGMRVCVTTYKKANKEVWNI